MKTLEDVQNKEAMQASLAKLRRLNRPTEFLFKARCEALDLEPVLIIARPGTLVDRTLAKELRPGSRTVYGRVRRRGRKLLFSPRGSAPNTKEMVRLIAKLGRQNQVTLPRKNIIINTPVQTQTILANDTSLSTLRRVRKPTPFVLQPKWTPLDGPAFLLSGGGRDRFFSQLRGAGSIEGTANRVGRAIELTLTQGTGNPTAIRQMLTKACRAAGISAPQLIIQQGTGSAAQDVASTSEATAPSQTSTKRQTKSAKSPSKSTKATAASSATTRRRSTPQAQKTAPPSGAPSSSAQQASSTQQGSTAAAEPPQQDRTASNTASTETTPAVDTATPAAAEAPASTAKSRASRKGSRAASTTKATAVDPAKQMEEQLLAKYKKQLARAGDDVQDTEDDIAEETSQMERETTLRGAVKTVDTMAALNALFGELQEQLIGELGKPDKDLQRFMRGLPQDSDADRLTEAQAACLEWLDERIEEYTEDIDDLRKELAEATERRDTLQAKVDALQALD